MNTSTAETSGRLVVVLKHLSHSYYTALFPQHGNFFFFFSPVVTCSNVSLFEGKSI